MLDISKHNWDVHIINRNKAKISEVQLYMQNIFAKTDVA